jgi:heat shock protein HslJ
MWCIHKLERDVRPLIRIVVGLGLSLGVSLLACSRLTDGARQTKNAIDLDGTEWVLSSLNGQPLIAGSRVALEFERGSFGGYGGCNWYGGAYTATAGELRIGEVGGTARTCGAPAGVVQQEEAYYSALRQVATYDVVDKRLELRNRGSVIMTLVPRARAAMDPAALVGTRWRLRAVNDTAQDAEPPITLNLMAREMGGFGGCRGYTGTYEARGDRISFPSIAMTATECGMGEAALLREGRFTTDLSEATYYRIQSNRLEIITAPGRQLMFSAQ